MKVVKNTLYITNRRGTRSHELTAEERRKNRRKSGVRAKVEDYFGITKHHFGFAKVRYRGMAKNADRFFVTCILANLFILRKMGALLRSLVRPACEK